ncbi:GDSL-type esterase/lipase family protein [Mycetocola reblochoni]|uniref:SGNH hydrolase-type esterase domain-containing protein n=1 Tax=Mycetocola reblochoni REB411 TaxID=1255698 RepID=A0A1R4J2G8_9MICO|nr:SGNH/GDSL hydrolase family protein [Mycetocola reblochoni]SJN25945.1 hypothetical protein FM119_04865 [Mycetocola reblochoni REB411]
MTVVASATGILPLLHGAAELEPGSFGGWRVHRLPAWARAQHDSPLFRAAELAPMAVRLRLTTPARRVRVRLVTSGIAGATGVPSTPVRSSSGSGEHEHAVPLGVAVSAEAPADIRGGVATIEIEHDGSDTPVELHLPHGVGVELVSVSADGPLTAAPDHRPLWVHYGSSISHGAYLASDADAWPIRAARALDWQLHSLAFAGNAQLDGFVARHLRTLPADLVTLKVGINLVNADSMRERAVRPALHSFLDTVREAMPTTPVLMITAVSCPIHEETPGPVVPRAGGFGAAERRVEDDAGALTLRRTREIVEDVVAGRRRTDPALDVIDRRRLLGEDDVATLYDRLHPDRAGSRLMADRAVPLLRAARQRLAVPSPTVDGTGRDGAGAAGDGGDGDGDDGGDGASR